jgi:hypothetical protein
MRGGVSCGRESIDCSAVSAEFQGVSVCVKISWDSATGHYFFTVLFSGLRYLLCDPVRGESGGKRV